MVSKAGKHTRKHLYNKEEVKCSILQSQLVKFSFYNLLLVALLGLLLRSFPFLQNISLSYKNLLHGHSHFAFGGWVMPVMLALLLKYFPESTSKVAYKHWRNIAYLLLSSAYGMLLSFPFQGYGAVSIIFSTLSVGAGFYLTIIIWKVLKGAKTTTSTSFLRWGVFYLALSAIGPFATGPLISLGYQGTPIYYNAVYFYLHFQYNGWFTFAVLALLYRMMENNGVATNNKRIFLLFNIACIPSYILSILWNQPGFVFNIVGGLSAFIQLVGFFYLLQDLKLYSKRHKIGGLFKIAFFAFFLKLVLQLISSFPDTALLAYHQRNFVIAYLHLVLLGFISLFVIATIIESYKIRWVGQIKVGVSLFLFSLFTTESLLVLQALAGMYGITFQNYSLLLLLFSCCFPLGIVFIMQAVYKAIFHQKPFWVHTKEPLHSDNNLIVQS